MIAQTTISVKATFDEYVEAFTEWLAEKYQTELEMQVTVDLEDGDADPVSDANQQGYDKACDDYQVYNLIKRVKELEAQVAGLLAETAAAVEAAKEIAGHEWGVWPSRAAWGIWDMRQQRDNWRKIAENLVAAADEDGHSGKKANCWMCCVIDDYNKAKAEADGK